MVAGGGLAGWWWLVVAGGGLAGWWWLVVALLAGGGQQLWSV